MMGPPWSRVLAETIRVMWGRRPVDVSWTRRGDAIVQIVALLVTVGCAAPSPRVAMTQVMVACAAVVVVWVLGILPGAHTARTVALVALLGVNGTAVLSAPHLPQLGALAASLLAAGVGHFAPHPDTMPVEPVAVDPRSVDGIADALIATIFKPDPPPTVAAIQEGTADLSPVGIMIRQLGRSGDVPDWSATR